MSILSAGNPVKSSQSTFSDDVFGVEIRGEARTNMKNAQEKQIKQADERRRKIDFDVGDMVWVSTKN